MTRFWTTRSSRRTSPSLTLRTFSRISLPSRTTKAKELTRWPCWHTPIYQASSEKDFSQFLIWARMSTSIWENSSTASSRSTTATSRPRSSCHLMCKYLNKGHSHWLSAHLVIPFSFHLFLIILHNIGTISTEMVTLRKKTSDWSYLIFRSWTQWRANWTPGRIHSRRWRNVSVKNINPNPYFSFDRQVFLDRVQT